jgi:hypothetical protein
MLKNAIISEDQKYRYWLYRHWAMTGPNIGWVMLNPSTADANIDDNTINRCIAFSKAWGYASMVVVNKDAFRSTDPDVLKTLSVHEASGPDNDFYLHWIGDGCHRVVCAWGNPGGNNIPLSLRCPGGLWHLGRTKSGAPKHPLYLPKTTELQRWI